jgi:hypothetical protein
VDISSHPVLIVMAIAVTASLLAEIRFASVRVPVVVWEMVFGIVLGPQLLGLVRADRLLEWLGSVGLAALFFMAGMDLELQKIKGRPLSLAVRGWTVSLVLGFIAAAVLHVWPFGGILLARFGIYSLKLSQASGGWTIHSRPWHLSLESIVGPHAFFPRSAHRRRSRIVEEGSVTLSSKLPVRPSIRSLPQLMRWASRSQYRKY